MGLLLQNHHISFRLLLFSQASFFSWHESDRMWNTADRVEDSPWSGGGKRGLEGAGFQVWVTVGRKGSRSCLFTLWGWQPRWTSEWGGWVVWSPLGSFTPIITFTAAGAGLSGRTRVKKRKKSLPWCTLLKHAGLQVGVEWGTVRWILWSTAQHERTSSRDKHTR